MKINVLFLLFALFAPLFTFAQQNEGVIHFEEKVNVHRTLPPEAADMKAMIPEFRTHQSELLFNATESLYRNVEEEEDDDAGEGGGVVMRIQRPEATFYRNFATQRKVDYREFFGKNQNPFRLTPLRVKYQQFNTHHVDMLVAPRFNQHLAAMAAELRR